MYSYYICSRHDTKKDCSPHRIPKDRLESDVLSLLQAHIANVLDLQKILEYVDIVPFQQMELRELENRKEELEERVARNKRLRDHLYEDMKEGIILQEDYMEMYAEAALRSLEQEISSVLEQSSDKFQWLSYFKEHKNVRELTRAVAVELIDRIRIMDKKHIEVIFNFDDCYQSMLGKLEKMGCKIENADGRLAISGKEVG